MAHEHGEATEIADVPRSGSTVAQPVDSAKAERDPACGMIVDPHVTAHRAERDGHAYYFCSAGCRTKFVADPVKYLTPSELRSHEPVAEGTI